MRKLVVLLLAAGACGPTIVDPDGIDPIFAIGPEYETWYRIDSTGPVPGHGDTYRIIYVNDLARENSSGVFDRGAMIVKEVHELDGEQPGALSYIGVMRFMVATEAPDGVELGVPTTRPPESGWLFTYLADDIESDEEYRSSCWDECHAAAPYSGTFFDYVR